MCAVVSLKAETSVGIYAVSTDTVATWTRVTFKDIIRTVFAGVAIRTIAMVVKYCVVARCSVLTNIWIYDALINIVLASDTMSVWRAITAK